MGIRLLKRLVALGDGAAMFVYLFATEWGYPPTEGSQASVDMHPEPGAMAKCWFNEPAVVEWEAAALAKKLVSETVMDTVIEPKVMH